MKRMSTRVLVVDDDAATREKLRRDLSARGYDVNVAHDRASALVAARRSAPDWAIIEQRLTRALADRSGLDLADDLLAAHPRLRMLIHTNDPDIDAAFRSARRARVVGYLAKPATIDDILAKMEGRATTAHPKPLTFEHVERAHARRVFLAHGRNLTRASLALGVSRETLRRKLR